MLDQIKFDVRIHCTNRAIATNIASVERNGEFDRFWVAEILRSNSTPLQKKHK